MANPEGFNQYKHGEGPQHQDHGARDAEIARRAAHEQPTISATRPPKAGMTHRVEIRKVGHPAFHNWAYQSDARKEESAYKTARMYQRMGFETRVIPLRSK